MANDQWREIGDDFKNAVEEIRRAAKPVWEQVKPQLANGADMAVGVAADLKQRAETKSAELGTGAQESTTKFAQLGLDVGGLLADAVGKGAAWVGQKSRQPSGGESV
jgi:hypothetical protein